MKSIAIICGGPSLERGISLNSARSAMDHLSALGLCIEIIYVNHKLDFFHIEKSQLYSNTPSDFDFKLKNKLEDPISFLSQVDIVLPAIHGQYGEDGTLQEFLEINSIPFIGSSSKSCKSMFSKININKVLRKHGFDTTELVKVTQSALNETDVKKIFNIKSKVAIKPDASGSSIGVSIVDNLGEIYEKVNEIFTLGIDNTAVIEEYCEGSEFTVIVLQNNNGLPVALIPTQIEILSENKIFDYRKKYLPTNATRWHCPPKFDRTTVKRIMSDAERIFQLFEMRDFIRIDGWLLDDGRLVFSDINPMSGLEQNSFVFQQAAWCGLTHRDLLHYILQNACARYNLRLPMQSKRFPQKDVFVLFGGDSAEKQISLMSGTNVWLKLLSSTIYRARPFLLDDDCVWFLPYQYTMNHTVEEIKYNCQHAERLVSKLRLYVNDVRENLGVYDTYSEEIPYKLSLNEFLNYVKLESAFLFLGLHGGVGEDGTIQAMLEEKGIEYNGSNSLVSKLCMNKYESGKIVIPAVISLSKILCEIADKTLVDVTFNRKITYEILKTVLSCEKFIIKPCSDGCSAGVMRISNQKDLDKYVSYICNHESCVENDFIVEALDDAQLKQYIIEPLVEVDAVTVTDNRLIIERKNGWIEMTVGVVEENGLYHSLNPSITVAEHDILSLEEKFQGGTGINLTPPPPEVVSREQLELIKKSIEEIGLAFKLQNYARVDIFFNTISDQVILIEVNTLPALTPSTVIFHQALAEKPAVYPTEFIEKIISKKLIS